MSSCFPPQHLAEQTLVASDPPAAPGIVVQAQLAGTSRIAYQLSPGQVLTLTAAGILGACSAVRPGGPGATETWIELPFLLPFAPAAPGLRTEHGSTPVAGPDGATALWLARFGGDARAAGAAGLELHPLDLGLPGLAQPAFVTTPSPGLRARIAQSAARSPATATRLELTALGGNLAASGEWDGFTWHQRTSLGRDQFVRTEERGYLYPFGLPAVQTIVTERDPGGGAHVAAGQPVVLRTAATLRLGRTVAQAPPGTTFGRTFPFDRVEVTAARFSGLDLPSPDYVYTRPTYAIDVLQGQITDLEADQRIWYSQWAPFAGGLTTEQDVATTGDGNAGLWIQLQATVAANGETIAAINEADAAKGVILDRLAVVNAQIEALQREPQPPEGLGSDPALIELLNEARGLQIEADGIPVNAALRRDLIAQNAQLGQQMAQLHAAFAHLVGQPRGAAEVASAGGEGSEAASAYLQDQAQIDALNQRIATMRGATSDVTVTEWPMQGPGQRLLFPVRLSRGDAPIEVAMPMLFVKDAHLAPVDDLLGYDWDQDPDLAARADAAWAGPTDAQLTAQQAERDAARDRAPGAADVPAPVPASAVAAGGAVFDLVGSGRPLLVLPIDPVQVEGRWFADVGFAAIADATYSPQIRLSLARLQQHSLTGPEISVLAKPDLVSLLPTRRLTVDRSTFVPVVTLSGTGPANPVQIRLEQAPPGTPLDGLTSLDGGVEGAWTVMERFATTLNSPLTLLLPPDDGQIRRIVVREFEAVGESPLPPVDRLAQEQSLRTVFVGTMAV